jgi:hypothetical protein
MKLEKSTSRVSRSKEVVPVTGRTKVGFGIGLLLVGLVLIWNGFGVLGNTNSDGRYALTEPLAVEVSSRAVVTDDVELLRGHYECYSDLAPVYWFFSTPDDVRVRGVAADSDTLFMGIAPADAVAGYLDGVDHDEITEWGCFGFIDEIEDVVYTRNEGTTDPAAPETEDFWVASVSGSGGQTLDWMIEGGEWALLIMNADGSPGVSADVRFGAATPSAFMWIGVASLIVGLVAAPAGVLMILPSRLTSPLPSRPGETPRWTVRGRPVLPTTLAGRIAVLSTVLIVTAFAAPIFLVLAVRKGDRSLLLVLPLVASIIVALLPLVVVLSILVG